MPLLETSALAYVASKILDSVVGDAVKAVGQASASRLRTMLGRDRATLACQLALARSEERFASAYPQLHGALFDQTFLAERAAPLLARALTRNEKSTAAELAAAWAEEIGGHTGQEHREGIEPAAAEFLGWWREELGHHEVFRAVLDSRSLDSIADSGQQTLDEIRLSVDDRR